MSARDAGTELDRRVAAALKATAGMRSLMSDSEQKGRLLSRHSAIR